MEKQMMLNNVAVNSHSSFNNVNTSGLDIAASPIINGNTINADNRKNLRYTLDNRSSSFWMLQSIGYVTRWMIPDMLEDAKSVN